MDKLQNFAENQMIFIVEYAATDNMSRACAAAGVNRGTGYAWMNREDIANAVQEIRSQALTDAWNSLSSGLQKAVDTVKGVLESDATTTNNKLRAAELIITQARILTETQEIIARIERLEEIYSEK